MADYAHLQLTIEGRLATVALRRPAQRNALSQALMREPVSYTHLTLPTNREV